jgi:hypothetical protein
MCVQLRNSGARLLTGAPAATVEPPAGHYCWLRGRTSRSAQPVGAGRGGWTSQTSSGTSSSATPRPTAPGPNGWRGSWKPPATPPCCRRGTCPQGPPSSTPWTRPSSRPAMCCWCRRRPTCVRRWPRRRGGPGSRPTPAAPSGGCCRCGWRPANRQGCWPTGSGSTWSAPTRPPPARACGRRSEGRCAAPAKNPLPPPLATYRPGSWVLHSRPSKLAVVQQIAHAHHFARKSG